MEAEADCLSEELEVRVSAGRMDAKLHMTDWAEEQRDNPILHAWLKDGKEKPLKTYFPDDLANTTATLACIYAKDNFIQWGKILYLCKTPPRDVDTFFVLITPKHISRWC